MPAVPKELHPTESFWADVDVLLEKAGEAAPQARAALWGALNALDRDDWKEVLHAEPYGHFGDEFSCPFYGDYVLIVRVATDRDPDKQLLRAHFWLKRVLRRPG